jgi:integrase
MPRLTNRPPRQCHHTGTDQDVIYIGGKAIYLGKHGSKEAKQRYQQEVAKWYAAQSGQPAAPRSEPPHQSTSNHADLTPVKLQTPTIAEVLVQFKAHAERYYGTSRETDNLREALGPLREKFGYLPMDEFGPLQLRSIRNEWVEEGLARNTINARAIRIRRFFRWACSHELIETTVLDRLNTVEPLMPGRGGMESQPKTPVAWEAVEKTLPYLPEMVQAMVLFAWHTGARPGEVTSLTTAAIDRTADIWVAKLKKHKTVTWGKARALYIGRSAQLVITPWLRPDEPDEPIFSPLRVDERQSKRLKGKRPPGRVYSRAAFQQVIRRACRRAGVEAWSPNLLRHAYGVRLTDVGGVEAAQVALGHSRPDTSLVSTAAARKRALETIRELG